MAKRKSATIIPDDVELAPGMEELLGQISKGDNGEFVCLATESEKQVWGLPVDHLSYRYLTDNNIYHMGKVLGLAGVKESCKSAFAMSLGQIWCDHGGVVVYIDTENKKSAILYRAIVGEDGLKRTLDYKAFSTEQWQSQVFEAVEAITENSELESLPVLIIIDSLGGVNSDETEKKIAKEGSAGRSTGGMVKALSHNAFFRSINRHIHGKPYTVVYVNHLSDDPMSPIQGQKKKPGGTGQDYHAVQDVWFSVLKSKPTKKFGYTEKSLKVKVAKNSFGESQRNLEIPFRWIKDEETGETERVWFDWDAATAKLLADPDIQKLVKDVCSISVSANKYTSTTLGLSKVQDSELGAAIRENATLREQISDLLGVNRCRIWPDLDLSEEERALYEQHKFQSRVEKQEVDSPPTSEELGEANE
jgi:hypothetical protein